MWRKWKWETFVFLIPLFMFVLSTVFSIFSPCPNDPFSFMYEKFEFFMQTGCLGIPQITIGGLNRFYQMGGWVFHLYVAYLLQCALVWGALALPSQLGLNMNCSARSTDVFQPEKLDIRNHSFRKLNLARELHAVKEHPSYDVIFGQKLKREQFTELDKGDTSRNIVEMIFRSASMNPEKQNKKIERVLKVMNSPEILQRFEEYRETVKKRARGLCKRNPRSMVDGNELLMFYATSMSCCCSRKAPKILALCENHICGVCRIIQSGFETEETKTNGIQMSAISDASDDEIASVVKGKKVKKAVVACRVIAGRVAGMVGGGEEGFDSVKSDQLVHLFLRNPSAVLPCFVIVCS